MHHPLGRTRGINPHVDVVEVLGGGESWKRLCTPLLASVQMLKGLRRVFFWALQRDHDPTPP